MKTNRFLLVAIVAAGITCLICFTGCVSTDMVETPATPVLAGDWILASAVAHGAEAGIPSGESITLSLDENGGDLYALYGFSGVNNYTGSASVTGNDFIVGPMAVTMVAGDPEHTQFEQLYFSVLNTVHSYTITDTALVLSSADGNSSLVFVPLVLDGTSWTLTGYNTGDAVVSVALDLEVPGLEFTTDGTVSGFAGVNRVTGSVVTDKTLRTVSFSQLATTRMAGSPDAMALEQIYLDLLGKTQVYQMSGSTLRLMTADGMTLLVFTKTDIQ